DRGVDRRQGFWHEGRLGQNHPEGVPTKRIGLYLLQGLETLGGKTRDHVDAPPARGLGSSGRREIRRGQRWRHDSRQNGGESGSRGRVPHRCSSNRYHRRKNIRGGKVIWKRQVC